MFRKYYNNDDRQLIKLHNLVFIHELLFMNVIHIINYVLVCLVLFLFKKKTPHPTTNISLNAYTRQINKHVRITW